MAFYFIKKKIKKKANFDITMCDTMNALIKNKYRPSVLFLAAKED